MVLGIDDTCCCCCPVKDTTPLVVWNKNRCPWEAKKVEYNLKEFKNFKITEHPGPISHTARDLKFEQLKTYVGKQDPTENFHKCLNRAKKVLPLAERTGSAQQRKVAVIKENIKYHKKRPVYSPINMFRLCGHDYGNAFYRNLYAKFAKERNDKAAQLLRIQKKVKSNRGAFHQKGRTCGLYRINKNIWNPPGPRIYPTIEKKKKSFELITKKKIQIPKKVDAACVAKIHKKVGGCAAKFSKKADVCVGVPKIPKQTNGCV